MPDVLDTPDTFADNLLEQGDYEANQDLAMMPPAQEPAPPATPTAPTSPQPQSKVPVPPPWKDVQALPDYQKGTQQQRQNAFNTWITMMHDYGEANGYKPAPAEQKAINEWGAKQARDLGMPSFIDPITGIVQPINTGQIQDSLVRFGKAVGAGAGNMIEGLAHGSRYINPTVWADNLLEPILQAVMSPDEFQKYKSSQPDITSGVEQEGEALRSKAEAIPVNPLNDNALLAKTSEFFGSLLPAVSTGGAGVVTGAGQMAQQFKNDAEAEGLSPDRQEVAFGTGAAVGALSQKFAETLPFLQEAQGANAIKQVFSQSTGKILLQALARNSARGAAEGAAQSAAEQAALGHDLTSRESLQEDLDAALTNGLGAGVLGAGFKSMGIAEAKGVVRSQWESHNDDLQSMGLPTVPYADYVKARLAAGVKDQTSSPSAATPPPLPSPDNPLVAHNARIEQEVSSSEGTDEEAGPSETMQATHPVFGEGDYKPEELLGTMTTSDIAPGVQQLHWNDLPTDRVRRVTTNDNGQQQWQYDFATPDETQSPQFQTPQLTRETLGQTDALKENQAITNAAQAVGPATTEEVSQHGETEQSEPQPVLDEAQLGNSSGADDAERGSGTVPGPERADDQARVPSPQSEGEGSAARAPETDARVNEGGGAEEVPAPPPRDLARNGYVEDKGIFVDPAAKTLPAAHKAAFDGVVRDLKGHGVTGVRLQISKDHSGMWVFPWHPTDADTIFVNPEAIGKTKDKAVLNAGAIEEYWHLLHGDAIRAQNQEVVPTLLKIFDEMTDESIRQVAREYRGRLGQLAGVPRDMLSESDRVAFAGEYARMLQLRNMGEKTVEQARGTMDRDSEQTAKLLAKDKATVNAAPTLTRMMDAATVLDSARRPGKYTDTDAARFIQPDNANPTDNAGTGRAGEKGGPGRSGTNPRGIDARAPDGSRPEEGRSPLHAGIETEDERSGGFYSQLSRVIDAKMPGRASADQIRSMLKGNGVKDDEIKWSGLDDYLKQNPSATKADIQRFLKEEGAVRIETHVLKEGESRYGQYQLPGGTDYREQVFSLPDRNPISFEQWKRALPESLKGQPDEALRLHYNAEMNAREGGYTSSHFPEVPNYLAHMRLNDRMDAEGKPGTFIEELQSDRHQAGREEGYIDAEKWAEREKELKAERDVLAKEVGKFPRSESEWSADHYAKAARLSDINDELREGSRGIPDAPFRKTWHEFLFRSALKDAVNAGKEWIGWTTGETQADRYDLSKQIDSIRSGYEGGPGSDKKYTIEAIKDGKKVIHENSVPSSKLPDLVGKDLAQKIVDFHNTGNNREKSGVFSGLDLKVGGEGMKGFYDNILPQYVAKFAKKWGVKPERSNIAIPETNGTGDSGRLRYEVYDPQGQQYDAFPSRELADQAAHDAGPGYTVKSPDTLTGNPIWKLPITDAMRESVQNEGLPLFANLEEDLPPSSRGLLGGIRDILGLLKQDVHRVKKFDDFARIKNRFSADLSANVQEVGRIIQYVRDSVKDPVRRDGITNYIEANGDKALLSQRAEATKDKQLRAGYEAALNLTPEEIKMAGDVRRNLELYRQLGQKWGLEIGSVENYVPHIWQEDLEGNPKVASGRQLNTSFRHSKERKLASYFEGEQLGYAPQTKDISSLLGSYINDLNYAITSRKFIKGLSEGKASDGRPLAGFKFGGLNHLPTEGEQKGTVLINRGNVSQDHDDYRDRDLPPALSNWVWKGELEGKTVLGRDSMALHPEAYHDVKNIFGQSAIKDWWNAPASSGAGRLGKLLVRGAFKLNVKGKTTLFGVAPSLFHPVQIMNEAISHRTMPLDRESYIREPDLSDPHVRDWADHGAMLAPNQASRSIFMEGMNQANDNLIFDAARLLNHLPGGRELNAQTTERLKQGTEAVQRWIFETYIPSLKLRFCDIVLDRNKERFAKELESGAVSEDDLKYLTARQANNAFGHLNYIDIARNPTVQHLMSFAFLAPDFFEARFRHTGQALQGLLGGKGGWEQSTSLAAMGIAMYLTARLVNGYLNNGDVKWDYPFSVVAGNKAYTMRTQVGDLYRLVGVPWQNGHFAWRGLFQNWRSWVSGRESPMARFAGEALFGVNYRGEPTTMADAIRDTLAGNFPISLQPVLSSATKELPEGWKDFLVPKTIQNNPISPFEQFLQSVGIQVSRYSPITRAYQMASEWKNDHATEFNLSAERGTFTPSQYTPLRYALEDGDYTEALARYHDLVADKKNAYKVIQGFRDSLDKPFTGDNKAERAFRDSLSPGDAQVYDAALQRRSLIWARFEAARALEKN